MTSTPSLLPCGVSSHDLNALVDYTQGARDALAQQRAGDLDRHVAHCPYCQQTLDSLEHLHTSARTLIDEESAFHAEGPWLEAVLRGLTLETRPGRRIPLAPPRPDVTLDQTEGSLRALVRNRVSDDDALVVRTRLDGELNRHDAHVRIGLTIHVRLGRSIPAVIARVRRNTTDIITASTSLIVDAVDVVVADTFGSHQEVCA